MSKNLLQDIKVKRLQTRAKPKDLNSVQEEFHSDEMEQETIFPRQMKVVRSNNSSGDKNRSRYMLWFVAVACIIFFLFSISYLFLKATVTVNPKMKEVVIDKSLSASKNSGTDFLPFDLMVISGEENKIIETTEERDVLEKAKGVAVIYNTFSSLPQRLDIDTRLQGSNGKIYKTEKQITVPGMKGKTPGSVEVGIYASAGGEEYNSGPLDFTIVGFKGTPKYSKFYGRSKSGITGGFKGKAPFLSETDKKNTTLEMKKALQMKLFKKATDQIPSGFVLFEDAVFLDIDDGDVDPISSEDRSLNMRLKGTLYGFLLNESKLTEKIIEDNAKEDPEAVVYVSNLRNLIFSMSPQTDFYDKDSASFEDIKSINFNLRGTAKIVWKVDENNLIKNLLGQSKKNFNQILFKYPNIDSANVVINPFWKSSFPDKSKDIKVIVNYPK